MNNEVLLILDGAIRNALIVFLLFLACFLSYTYWKLHERKKQLADYFDDLYVAAKRAQMNDEEEEDEEIPWRDHFVPNTNHLQPIFRSVAVSLLVGVLSFVFFAFIPLPFLHNFATVRTWQTDPLRLTLLEYERFYEGFSLDGEVWNQSEDPIEGLQATVRIRDNKDEILEELTIPVNPTRLLPGYAGKFDLRYTENSPFLAGYQVIFVDSEGNVIPHVEGFDVR